MVTDKARPKFNLDGSPFVPFGGPFSAAAAGVAATPSNFAGTAPATSGRSNAPFLLSSSASNPFHIDDSFLDTDGDVGYTNDMFKGNLGQL